MKTNYELINEARHNLNSAMCSFIKGTFPETKLDGKYKKVLNKSFVDLLGAIEKMLVR